MSALGTNITWVQKMVLKQGLKEKNKRTGTNIIVHPEPLFFKYELADMMYLPNNRQYYLRSAAAELAWHCLGTTSPDFILKHCRAMWEDFVEEDGTIPAAYGHRFQKGFGRNQWALAVQALKLDPSNRQVYLSCWDPGSDGLGQSSLKNVPCPVAFSLCIIKDRLNIALTIRSSDVMIGLPYDLMYYQLLYSAFFTELKENLPKLQRGFISVTMNHAHVYEGQEGLLGWPEVVPPVQWPKRTIPQIAEGPGAYVQECRRLSLVSEHPYKPAARCVV